MIEYTIIEWEGDPTEIGRLLSEGWRPQGGVAAVIWEDREGYGHTYYTQAMVRETLTVKKEVFRIPLAKTPPTEDELAQLRADIQAWQASPFTVSTEGASWAMETQCDCTYNDALGHSPDCPASPEHKAWSCTARPDQE
jgi:hypothetical protein